MINDKIEEYYFVDVYLDKDNVYYPQNVKARVWMRDTFPTSYLIGDGSPFCIFDEGFIIKKSELEKIKEYGKDFSILADVYNLDNSSWKTIDDFIMDFEDGDVETSQFIFVDSLDKLLYKGSYNGKRFMFEKSDNALKVYVWKDLYSFENIIHAAVQMQEMQTIRTAL